MKGAMKFPDLEREDRRAAALAPGESLRVTSRPDMSARLERMSYVVDMAAEIDRPEEVMAERWGVLPAVAAEILAAMDEEMERRMRGERAELLRVLAGEVLSKGLSTVKTWGLAFAADLDSLNGMPTQGEIARRLGLNKATVSHWVSYWRDLLELRRNRHEKRDQTRVLLAQVQTEDHWSRRKGSEAL